jgi:hypothetical protein
LSQVAYPITSKLYKDQGAGGEDPLAHDELWSCIALHTFQVVLGYQGLFGLDNVLAISIRSRKCSWNIA